ncbi:hypothetical protein EHS13_35370 [Paenibacillus psychroresistens]|uniref:Methane oxygenase PmoA n=1 Tax=Paenibacillus psychroresistens TaxID=1778678 RepID=A0A6B8RTQ2_9BACL|nr:PmoA family protein [Paenibacillus psychroresistens]QGQ99771.1 hypothetical protein EHS13_35370 [Paenibacillus psychroresistens]
MQTLNLKVESTETSIRIYRSNEAVPILEQHADKDKRPYIHPILAPDGNGILTENAPPHHPWQHGIYIGLNDVNGIGFWEEGLRNNPKDGSFQPLPLKPAIVDQNQVSWEVETLWLDPEGKPMLTELQQWRLVDKGSSYCLDFEWSLKAAIDLTFGQYGYGGLFLRMPYKQELGGEAINSEGQINSEAEGKRARWVASSMPIEGRTDHAGIAYMDHPNNPEHPVPWRVDNQMGISPSRCIAGQWELGKDEVQAFQYRILVFCGSTDTNHVNASWLDFASSI